MRQKFNRPLNLDTRYVGVVAAFRDLENAQWKAFTAVPVKEKEPEIYIFLKKNQILIGAKEPCGFFCSMWTPKPEPGTLYEVIE
jgi:predicted component of type VI protein secretion system